jgi:hypothetical protein
MIKSKKYERGKAYSTHRKDGTHNFLLENNEGRNHLEGLGLDGRITLKVRWEGVNWVYLPQ